MSYIWNSFFMANQPLGRVLHMQQVTGAAEAEGLLQFCCHGAPCRIGVVFVAGVAQTGAPIQQRGCDVPDEQEDAFQPVILKSEPRSECNI